MNRSAPSLPRWCIACLLAVTLAARADDLAEAVGRTAELPQVAVEAGLARAVAEYHALATRQATRRQAGT